MELLCSSDYGDRIQQIASGIDIEPRFAAFFNEKFLIKKTWKALIFELDFTDRDNVVSQVCARFGYETGLAVEVVDTMPQRVYRVALSHDDLFSVHNEFYIPSYLVIEERQEAFVIISDSDYFWGIAASEQFLLGVARNKPNEILADFRRGIDAYVKSQDHVHHKMGRLLDKYHTLCFQMWSKPQ